MPNLKRVVLSGGPGTGKTSIIQALEKRGYACMHEVSREIIQESLMAQSDVLPWKNLTAFTEKLMHGRVAQYKEAAHPLVFFDRSVIDSLAYLQKDGVAARQEWVDFATQNKYHTKVFITPPWQKIFTTDDERKESWQELLSIHQAIEEVYQKFGYQTIHVPKLTVQARVDFMLENL